MIILFNPKATKMLVAFLFSLVLYATLSAQDSTSVKPSKVIDPSKPTNLYTQVNVGFEYQSAETENRFGPRVNIQYALNPNNLFLLELPFQHNDRTNKFGITDIRARYFSILKRNISKKFIAFGTLIDVTAPTGSFENGLGSSSWSFGLGTIFGILASKKLALFPGVSFVHITRPSTDLIPESLKSSANGIGLQFNCSFRFDQTTFLFINPLPTFLNIKGNWSTNWAGELNLNKILIPNKFKMNAGWFPNFTNKIYGYKLGATFFL